MTPEELNRTMEFITQSQARLAAAQEQDREDRIQFENWSKDLSQRIVNLIEMQSRTLGIQSSRLDNYERQQRLAEQTADKREQAAERRHQESMNWQQGFQVDTQRRHEETLLSLRGILEKIADRMN